MAASSLTELRETLAISSETFTRSTDKPALGFVFTGQGSQWHAMGRELFSYQTFAKSMQESDAYLKDFGAEWSLLSKIDVGYELKMLMYPSRATKRRRVIACEPTSNQPTCHHRSPNCSSTSTLFLGYQTNVRCWTFERRDCSSLRYWSTLCKILHVDFISTWRISRDSE